MSRENIMIRTQDDVKKFVDRLSHKLNTEATF